ncbi:hypothetical protein BDN72DRAFT_829977 [Pluteus cervinus]|uniref:Uncharacterized protein n=1 Tax=Pluteus cervinus TaxID=181527 RepID=A0ACD3BFY8_9AGAR|nr:hypothetical protein BDN72DRAFT_829977 [Pluteus cervinus]
MDDDHDEELSVSDTPGEANELSPFEKQKASLQTYLDSLPYQCESVEEMQQKLEFIVGRIFVCAKAKNWQMLTTWDGMLQCWMLMRYPIVKTTRAKLVRLYYELSITPGIEARVIRNWADMLSRLLANKAGMIRKLEPADLQLPWQPLWRALQKEIWPKKRTQDNTRNVINLLFYVADQCKRYFPASEIPLMLETFIPLTTKETILVMVPVFASFLPPTHIHLYVPTLFKLWEAFNSSAIDDRLLDVAGELSETHIAGKAGDAGEGGAEWKDIGIWTQAQWDILVGKGLLSMGVPVGVRSSSATAQHADGMAGGTGLKIKKPVNRLSSFALILIFSMAIDGPVRESATSTPKGRLPEHTGYIAGSRSLESLDKLVTSTESFFHPSNSGPWTLALTTFIHRLTCEFIRRVKEEELDTCKVPVTRRLTPSIRRAFVTILRTPALLAMFSKDAVSASYAQGALRNLSYLESNLIMPELLERAYNGLEVVNETHRTTAVLNILSGISRPLVTERLWLGGQKHLVPLLELCIPGIDLNDPAKTICTTMFVISAIQHIKIGDLSTSPSGISHPGDQGMEMMTTDDGGDRIPDGTELGSGVTLSLEEERVLVRDSTASFADWVTSLFRRVFALYENLPEEGGKKNTTGGKQEESVLKSIKSMLDVVCLHLSDSLFDLVLNQVHNYATTNAKSNAVRAFGQLIACLARVKPDLVIRKFLPYCKRVIEEELRHGASSVRTTSQHAAVPSDTTLHWNMAILRGCLGYGGATLLKYKEDILEIVTLLVEKTKGERGYSSTGRLITRILHTLAGVYPYNSRFVNTDEWNDPAFNSDHNIRWGRLYEPSDVQIEWHMPTDDEISFVITILENIAKPAINKVEGLIAATAQWDSVERNDFCRYLTAIRSTWMGLPTFLKEQTKVVPSPCVNEDVEVAELLVSHLDVQAGFTLEDPEDPRYQTVAALRSRFGDLLKRAARALRQGTEEEDHTDAVIAVTKSIDVYLLEYGTSRGNFNALQKAYTQARDLNRMWPKQRDNSRLVMIRRAQVYHSGRVYMHATYRRRSELDDKLLCELVELSLSPYTRVRRHAQSVLHDVCGYYIRSTRYVLPNLFSALAKGNDPDRIKGALYVLWNKGIAAYALSDLGFHDKYLVSLLECQHEEKPSIQKLVNSLAQDCLSNLNEESFHTDAYIMDTPRVDEALGDLEEEFSSTFVDHELLVMALDKASKRVRLRTSIYNGTISSILDIASRPTTHWRYVQMATRFLSGLLRRDTATPPDVAKFLLEQSLSPQPTIRAHAQRAVVRLLAFIKMRTYSKSELELWFDEWQNPLREDIAISDAASFLADLNKPIGSSDNVLYVDKTRTGFLAWTPSVKAYRPSQPESTTAWDPTSQECIQSMTHIVEGEQFFRNLALLWSQETSKNGGIIDLRLDNVAFVKSLAKTFEGRCLDNCLATIEPLLSDSDNFKQRAGAELLAGVIRGSKHWPPHLVNKLWEWTKPKFDKILSQIKPDTLPFWEGVVTYLLHDRDARRNQPLVDWILNLPLEFYGDSAFSMSKSLALFGILLDSLGRRLNHKADHYVKLFLDHADTSYAEMRTHICHCLYALVKNQWQPTYPSTQALLQACEEENDPLHIREAKYMEIVAGVLKKLDEWRDKRLPPPRVSQSEYDKIGLTVLQWIWGSAHGGQACLVFPYILPMMPEILRMSELNDSSELQNYSSAVLYVLSAVSPPPEYVEGIVDNFVTAAKSSTSWRIRLHALPALVVFFYRHLLSIAPSDAAKVMDILLDCLSDENVEVREMASRVLSGVIRCSQRQSIIPLKNRFVELARRTTIPPRRDPKYSESLRSLHSAILGLCALIESLPYSVESWVPPLTEVLAPHATDPPPISTTIRKCASEFKKTHQDTWHKDQLMFNEDQLQSLSTMLVGTSYYA